MEISINYSLLLLLIFATTFHAYSTNISHDGRALIINGERKIIISGAIHYPRSTPKMWPELIRKAKEGGLDAIETYVFWNGHEPNPREYYFEGSYDLIRFLKEIHNAGLYAVLRIGPYACAEWNYGGIPAWLRDIPDMQFRTDNERWKSEMQNFTTLIVNMVKEERLLAPQGGPIILTQIENEYGNIMGPYGDAGKRYINWCSEMAQSLNVGVPWIMCQQSDAPQPMINTCNGFQCGNYFKPNNKNSPKMWTENWTGWFKSWGMGDPVRSAENVAYAVADFFMTNGTFQNYYMYHGGTNFGRTAGGPYIVTSYDYDAPLDEYGNLRQPKWGHLKNLHAAIKQLEKALTYGDYSEVSLGNSQKLIKYSGQGIIPACFLSNRNTTHDATIELDGSKYTLPAYSISILANCKKEVYNTAKVTAQTSLMVKRSTENQAQHESLNWSWRPEKVGSKAKSFGTPFIDNKLLEQVVTTLDKSDYLWYSTSVRLSKKEQMNLYVNSTGHILHAFVNGRLAGSQYSPNGNHKITFQQNVTFNRGVNKLSLLSATVGLQNYGSYYEQAPAGIVGGPIKLSGSKEIDLSQNNWFYKVGLDGEVKKIHLDEKERKWHSGRIPTNRPFTWYKTTFKSPLGSEPVVVDLLGLGKGEAWVNGQSIGRFWPSYVADSNGCKEAYCDYRGPYEQNRICRVNCGESSQRWYHVPREYLKTSKPNILTLFEEAGGDPTNVNFKTVTVGRACVNVGESNIVNLSCQGGQVISKVEFASFGDPKGKCGAFEKGACHSDKALSFIEAVCIGKESCSFDTNKDVLGNACVSSETEMKLAVQVKCYGV